MIKRFIIKWLGLYEWLSAFNCVHKDYAKLKLEIMPRSEIEAMLAAHFKEVLGYIAKPESTQVEEKKIPISRARNFSQFRDKVEKSVFSED